MDSDVVLGQLYYGWQGVANKKNYSLGTNCKNQKIEIGTEEAIKLYLYDRNIGAESELAKASTIDVRVEKAAVLSDLTTSGQTKDGSNFKSGTLYAYVKSDAQTATITPHVSGEGYSLTIDGKNAEAGKAHRVYLDMNSGESVSTVTVSKEGRKDKNYQVAFLAAPAKATPFFVENLKNDKIEYIVNDEINPLKSLCDSERRCGISMVLQQFPERGGDRN